VHIVFVDYLVVFTLLAALKLCDRCQQLTSVPVLSLSHWCHAVCAQVYLHLLTLYLSTPENPPVVSYAEETEHNALETNLAAAFRLLGDQANRIDTVQVSITLPYVVHLCCTCITIAICHNSRFFCYC